MGLQYSSFEGGKVFYKAAPAGQNMISLPIKNIGTGSTSDSTVQGIGSKKTAAEQKAWFENPNRIEAVLFRCICDSSRWD
jgi:hypothetical protein